MAFKTASLQFSTADINKAFEETKEQLDGVKDGTLVLITEDMYDSVIRFGRDNYVPFELVAAVLGLNKESQDWEVMWRQTLKFNMSLAIRDNHTMEIIAMFFIAIAKLNDKPDLTIYKDTKIKQYAEIVDYYDKKADIFKQFNVTELVAFKELSVGVEHRKRGIASFLVTTALQFVKNLGVGPICIRAEGSSNFSKRCFEKNGFESIYELPYCEYFKDGIQIIHDTGIHKSMIVYGQCINSAYI